MTEATIVEAILEKLVSLAVPEVVSKIKKADGIIYIKDNAPQPDEREYLPPIKI